MYVHLFFFCIWEKHTSLESMRPPRKSGVIKHTGLKMMMMAASDLLGYRRREAGGREQKKKRQEGGAKQREQTAWSGAITLLHFSFFHIISSHSNLNLHLSVALRTVVLWFTSPTQILPSRRAARLKLLHQLVTWCSSLAHFGFCCLGCWCWILASSSSSSFLLFPPSASCTLSHPPSIPPGIRSDWRLGIWGLLGDEESVAAGLSERELMWEQWGMWGERAPPAGHSWPLAPTVKSVQCLMPPFSCGERAKGSHRGECAWV